MIEDGTIWQGDDAVEGRFGRGTMQWGADAVEQISVSNPEAHRPRHLLYLDSITAVQTHNGYLGALEPLPHQRFSETSDLLRNKSVIQNM
jgi:hypothetical protein